AQDFSMRYPLVDGQGNFGSIDGDSPAAMRYTEARLAAIAEELLVDLNMNTVDWTDNFDGSLQEPTVLPARLPNLLLNGSSGIAVGMATNIPPHNLREIAAAVSYMIDHYDRFEEISVDDLMQFVKGPDFPTGATILGGESLREVYATGRGRLIVRAQTDIEEIGRERQAIVVTEIPYQINKVGVIERLAQLVRDGKLNEISDLRDESDRKGMRIVIELKRTAQPMKVLNQIYKHTALQSTFGVQMLALVDGEPRTISLKRALQIYIEHRREVIRRRSEFELDRAQARAHILEGYLKALGGLDDVIKTIREAADSEEARDNLMILFDLSEAQARAILDLQLRRIAALERQKIEEEYQQVTAQIAHLRDLLAHPHKILALIRSDVNQLAEKFGDERRTRLDMNSYEGFDEADFVRDEEVLISITQRGYIKRSPSALYRTQGRGGRGVTGMATREEDAVEHLLSANSLSHVLFFTNRGKVYALRSFQIPATDRNGKGTIITGVIGLEPDEAITALTCVDDFDSGYFVMCTQNGKIKRVKISDFASVRANGLIAMSLDEDDRLRWVKRTTGNDAILIITARGWSIRFHEDDVRVMGRQAMGVNAIRLQEGDRLAGVDVVDESVSELLIVTARGYGKRIPLEEYRLQARYGMGLRTLGQKAIDRFGEIVSAHTLHEDDEITIITREGMALRTRAESIRLVSRAAMGVRLINLGRHDRVVSVAVVEASAPEHVEDAEDDSANGHQPDVDLDALTVDSLNGEVVDMEEEDLGEDEE
ncbi:MAG: DNA gyrase subunit A, partial [Anaerolineae bacterium]|nr:DNA gyrase subunit A [Anaerolineae bacterium]